MIHKNKERPPCLFSLQAEFKVIFWLTSKVIDVNQAPELFPIESFPCVRLVAHPFNKGPAERT